MYTSPREDNEALLAENTTLRAELDKVRAALGSAHYELAALVGKPSAPSEEDWPCQNSADRKCLHIAYADIREALGLTTLTDTDKEQTQ